MKIMPRELHPENLKAPKTPEEAREKGKKGGIASGKAKREAKAMTQLYKEALAKRYGKKTGEEIVKDVIPTVLYRCDSASVAMMKEIRESTEGTKQTVNLELSEEDLTTKLLEKIFKNADTTGNTK
ncbi:MAG TPA: hypothetical protein DCO75_07535 [Fibrobacteres bacterium]|nr:hypothetical protein [Fibrobacterota bacterium]